MKQKITLPGLFILVTLFSFGQKSVVGNYEKFEELWFENYKNDLAPFVWQHAIQKNKLDSKFVLPKSAQINKQRFDSLIVLNWDNNTSEWNNKYSKEEYIYDENDNITQNVTYTWNEDSSQWIANRKEEFNYDESGNGILYQTYYWNINTSQWDANDKVEYTYNGNGYKTQIINYSWNESTSQWSAFWKTEYTRNENGYITQSIGYTENTGQWTVDSKAEYTLDERGNMVKFLYYEWDKNTNQWAAQRENKFIYDENGNMTKNQEYNWNQTTSQWAANAKTEYNFDESGNVTLYLYYEWDKSTGQWAAKTKTEYSSDTNGNPTQEIYYRFDETTNEFKAYARKDFSYDLSYILSELILPPFSWYWPHNRIYIINKPIEFINYAWENDEWVYYRKGVCYYSEQNATIVSNLENEIIKIFPNPVFDNLNFSLNYKVNQATFELLNLHGQKIMIKEVSDYETISFKNIEKGLYLYNLYFNGIRLSGKLIKK